MNETFAAACRLLARLFHDKLDEETAGLIADMDISMPEEDPILSVEACREGMTMMKEYCAAALAGDGLLESSNDFHKLFVGPHKLLAAPWSSVYLGVSRTVFGPSAFEARKAFKENGFEIPEGTHEPSDHVAYEWQFVSDMLMRSVACSEAGDEEGAKAAIAATANFFNNLLATWMPMFCADITAGATTDFYRGLAKLTMGMTELGAKVMQA